MADAAPLTASTTPSASKSPIIRDTKPDPGPSSIRLDRAEFLDRGRLHELIGAFFNHVYPVQAMSFLQQEQLLRDADNGSASPLLLKAICAVSYRFLLEADNSDPDGGPIAAKWTTEVKHEIIETMDRITLSKLATILCILHHESNSGRMLSSWYFTALASRMALSMGLDSVALTTSTKAYAASPWVTQEVARRLMWSTLSFDALGSSAFDKYKLIHTDIDIPLPASEHCFQRGTPPATPSVSLKESATHKSPGSHSDGYMGCWVRLMLCRRDILALVLPLYCDKADSRLLHSYAFHTQSDKVRPWAGDSRFYVLNEELNRWLDNLPSNLAYTVDNMYSRHANSELGSLVGLHLLFDLVRLSLVRIGFSTPPEDSVDAAFKDAPPEFIKSCRIEAYRTGLRIRDRLRDVESYFPDYTSSSRLWTRSVHASLRIQIEHFVVVDPDVVSRDPDAIPGLKTLVNTAAKMTKYFSAERRFVSRRDYANHLTKTVHRSEIYWPCSLNMGSIYSVPWIVKQCMSPRNGPLY